MLRMRNASNKYQIGTSGFMVTRTQWISLECLNCIEINSTFYSLPTAKIVSNWSELPERVSFVIKASKYITHVKRLKDVRDAWNKLWGRITPLGGLNLPPRTAALRVHGARGYKSLFVRLCAHRKAQRLTRCSITHSLILTVVSAIREAIRSSMPPCVM